MQFLPAKTSSTTDNTKAIFLFLSLELGPGSLVVNLKNISSKIKLNTQLQSK